MRFKEELSLAPWHVREVFDLLDDSYQKGNWRHHSTETHNIMIHDFLLDKRLSALILLDLSKAFDSISHSI